MKFAIALTALMISSNVFAANSQCSVSLQKIAAEIESLSEHTDIILGTADARGFVKGAEMDALKDESQKRMKLRQQRMSLIASDICQ
jgi:hypothetical protein